MKCSKQLYDAAPNAGHKGLVGLEKYFDVQIITQNIDDLHERAGSKQVLHLHGELKKVRSSKNPNLIYDLEGWKLKPELFVRMGLCFVPMLFFSVKQFPTLNQPPNWSPSRHFRHYRNLFGCISGSKFIALCP